MDTAPPRPSRWWSIATAVMVVVTVVAGFTFTDDIWPFAPFRMFSYGNPPNGVVRRMAFVGDTGRGEFHFGSGSVGLRRAELEEQTHWDQRIPDDRMADLAAAYNSHHHRKLLHLQVVMYATPMRDGEKAGAEVPLVIGDWAAPSWTGPRTEVDLPPQGPWKGYNR